ncbi:MAG TPA: Ig-like domain-containing protein [Candidatus Saccharimonadales bacterium]|nr:Ig-like domain-containing protein [Candidatus Saccharimonadales bacterium]
MNLTQLIKPIVFIALVLLAVFLAFEFITSRHFHVVGTNPKTNKVATVSPFIKIKFNKPLSKKGVSINSSYSIIKSYNIQDKTLVITLKTPMTQGYNYFIRIKSIADLDGDTIVNQVFSFTPKYISPQDLPKDQQRALLQLQTNHPKSQGDVQYVGFSDLTNYGVASDQVANIEQFAYTFAPHAHTISIDPSSIMPVPHNRNSSSTSDTVNFLMDVDSTAYKAKIVYSNLNSEVRLYLFDSNTGGQVFDSNAPPKIFD